MVETKQRRGSDASDPRDDSRHHKREQETGGRKGQHGNPPGVSGEQGGRGPAFQPAHTGNREVRENHDTGVKSDTEKYED